MASQVDQKPFSSTSLQAAFGKLIDAQRDTGLGPIQYREAVEALRVQVKVEQDKNNEVFEFINQLLDGISTRSRARGDGRAEDWRLEELSSWLQRIGK